MKVIRTVPELPSVTVTSLMVRSAAAVALTMGAGAEPSRMEAPALGLESSTVKFSSPSGRRRPDAERDGGGGLAVGERPGRLSGESGVKSPASASNGPLPKETTYRRDRARRCRRPE